MLSDFGFVLILRVEIEEFLILTFRVNLRTRHYEITLQSRLSGVVQLGCDCECVVVLVSEGKDKRLGVELDLTFGALRHHVGIGPL